MEDGYVDQLKKFIIPLHHNKTNYFTTYGNTDGPVLTNSTIGNYIQQFYKKHIDQMAIELGILGHLSFKTSFWCQLYNSNTTSHVLHSHYGEGSSISWVHVLNAPSQKCFYFVDSLGNKIYPEKQSNFDLFAFPSWALHGVDPVEEPGIDRIIIAGNIYLRG